ncbi:peptide MFS transporter [Pedobacter insulae]|uniref:Proton-dependent oligopeptide transporter, POT family n=1 Tax=Pedobacter insulae TaxID=414048 RepID=A0A1I2URT1_9SPHI|nr:peptide MFS transporter [Pedobacter insulae]SFG79885.1 proton-dependent oligopeptide transporter, POT family [Pedobacter insulae]
MANETTSLSQDQALDLHLQKSGVETDRLINHPVGLFVLFFTEMWERFSYYGMRALLVLFLVSEASKGGWEWTRPEALSLYGWYTGLVYLTPIIGGLIADKLTGYRKAVILGALIMTMGHASMAMEGISMSFFYAGLVLMMVGNGLFKPNISSMVGKLYPAISDKKDAAYTIFYMGINSGAFLGILMCGYVGEKIGWHWGFGLAGIFMFFGMLQFYFGQKIFGVIGQKNDNKAKVVAGEAELPKKVVTERLMVIFVLSIFTIFFWMVFEQAGGSMTIFAKDYTLRSLTGSSGTLFKWADAALTIFPLIAVSVVLFGLAKKIAKKYPATILFTGLSFVIMWGLAIWKVEKEFTAVSTEVPASWFGILNSFFIVSLAPFFSKLWEAKFNPSGPIKFGLGLIFVGLGFAGLAYGGSDIPQGATVAQVSMFWLVFAYFFHTIGELCVSPVGLSYVSKLAPAKLVGLMFGVWFTCTAIGNWLAGATGGLIDKISTEYSISYFFLIFTIIPIIAGLLLFALNPLLKKWMNGVH